MAGALRRAASGSFETGARRPAEAASVGRNPHGGRTAAVRAVDKPSHRRPSRRPASTVGAPLRGLGLGRLDNLPVNRPVIRFEREKPGDLIRIDGKKLGNIDGIGHRITRDRRSQSSKRGTGWEALHVAIDDASRRAYTALLPDETKQSAIAFLTAFFRSHGIAVERILSDNGSAYKSQAFRDVLRASSLRHVRTRPYTPRTNGKAERFIQTSRREWNYAQPCRSSEERANAMHPWIDAFNTKQPQSAFNQEAPRQRLNNLFGNDN